MTAARRILALIDRARRLKPARVFRWHLERRGQLLAAGLSYQAIFAVFAAIWLGFAIAGVVLRANPSLERAFLTLLSTNVPGLIDDGSGTGAIRPDQLTDAGILNFTGLIAAGALLLTALGWLDSGREAVRAMFELGPAGGNVLLRKLKDLGLIAGFGAALLVSAGLSVVSTTALGLALGTVGIDEHAPIVLVSGRVLVLALLLALDTVVLAAFYRIVAGTRIPRRLLIRGSLLGAVALGVLKVLGTSLLGGASRNPLLASFAVIIGLLIWFNLICLVIVMTAAWIAVSARDAGIELGASGPGGARGAGRSGVALNRVARRGSPSTTGGQSTPWADDRSRAL